MELVWSSDDYVLMGQSYPGFPILLDADMRGVVPANSFLRYYLIGRGRVGSRKSWVTIGQHLYDYFSFLEAQRFEWSIPRLPGELGVVAAYRDHCVGVCKLNPRTINQRLSTVTRFYHYALQAGWIDSLPFAYEYVPKAQTANRLAHLESAQGKTRSADVMLSAPKRSIGFLSKSEIRSLLAAATNPTHKMMIRMGLQVGLRREEIATLPASYISNPDHAGDRSGFLKIRLDPYDGTGMRTKGNRARDVFISRELMSQLWQYLVHERSRLASSSSNLAKPLFLTERGTPWADDGRGFLVVLKQIGSKVGVNAWPHLLRHTYATYTLAALNKTKRSFDPIVFLRNQLGHASIETTLVYAHLVEEMVEEAVVSYDQEVSQWSVCSE